MPSPVVVLCGGRGKKCRYNGKVAHVLEKRGGGWVTVKVKGRQDEAWTRLAWRSAAWKTLRPNTAKTSLLDLDDDSLVKIFSFLGAGEPSDAFDDLNLSIEQIRDKQWAPESVITAFPLNQAPKLCNSLSKVCRRFRMVCERNLSDIMGVLDVDLTVFSWLHYIPWLVRYQLAFRSLKLRGFTEEDGAIALYLLQHGNTSRLTTLATTLGGVPSRFSLLFHTWQAKKRNGVMWDGEADEYPSPPSSDQGLMQELGFSLPVVEVESLQHFFRELNKLPLKLLRLKMQASLDEDSQLVIPPNPHLLRCLNIVVYEERHFAPGVLSHFPNLTWLKITGRANRPLDLHIESRSLRFIDFSDAGKRYCITRCICENLKYLICRDGPYGNGVRPHLVDGTLDWEARGIFQAGTTRFSGRFDDISTEEDEDLNVPDSCLIIIDG